MSAEEPSPRWLWVEESCGSKVRIDVLNGMLITCDLMIELTDVVFKACDPTNLLRKAVVSLLLALADKLHKVLDKIPHLPHAESGDCGVDHANDGGSEGPQVVVASGWSIQQQLLGGRRGFGGPEFFCSGVDNFFGGRIELRVLKVVVS